MIEILTKFDAVLSLVGGGLSQPLDGIIRYHSGQTPPTEAEIDTEVIRLQAEYDAQEYARERATAYPSVGDQLDMMMKDKRDGTTTHQTACEAVKTQFPKE